MPTPFQNVAYFSHSFERKSKNCSQQFKSRISNWVSGLSFVSFAFPFCNHCACIVHLLTSLIELGFRFYGCSFILVRPDCDHLRTLCVVWRNNLCYASFFMLWEVIMTWQQMSIPNDSLRWRVDGKSFSTVVTADSALESMLTGKKNEFICRWNKCKETQQICRLMLQQTCCQFGFLSLFPLWFDIRIF